MDNNQKIILVLAISFIAYYILTQKDKPPSPPPPPSLSSPSSPPSSPSSSPSSTTLPVSYDGPKECLKIPVENIKENGTYKARLIFNNEYANSNLQEVDKDNAPIFDLMPEDSVDNNNYYIGFYLNNNRIIGIRNDYVNSDINNIYICDPNV